MLSNSILTLAKWVVLLLFLAQTAIYTQTKVNVVTSSKDLASISQEIGGKFVRVDSLARGSDNLHHVLARPSFIRKVNKADLFIEIGVGMEAGWVPAILQQSRNSEVQPGNVGYCNASLGVPLLQKPAGLITRGMGDIHILGNPHYWIDPIRGVVVARNILEALKKVDVVHIKQYKNNFLLFKEKIKKLYASLKKKMLPHKGKKIVAYHNEFIYIANRFKLDIIGYIEPKPGVTPSPWHIRKISDLIKREKVKTIIATPWNILSYAKQVSERTGAKLLILPTQTGSAKGAKTYLKMLENYITMLAENL